MNIPAARPAGAAFGVRYGRPVPTIDELSRAFPARLRLEYIAVPLLFAEIAYDWADSMIMLLASAGADSAKPVCRRIREARREWMRLEQVCFDDKINAGRARTMEMIQKDAAPFFDSLYKAYRWETRQQNRHLSAAETEAVTAAECAVSLFRVTERRLSEADRLIERRCGIKGAPLFFRPMKEIMNSAAAVSRILCGGRRPELVSRPRLEEAAYQAMVNPQF